MTYFEWIQKRRDQAKQINKQNSGLFDEVLKWDYVWTS
jgi:hypothetical protein